MTCLPGAQQATVNVIADDLRVVRFRYGALLAQVLCAINRALTTWSCTPEPLIVTLIWDAGGTDEFFRLVDQQFRF